MKTKEILAEFVATFQLVLIGTGSIVYAQETLEFGDLVIGIAFGLAVYVGILIFSKISGAHMNPAVSLMGILLKKNKLTDGLLLIVTQIIAGLCASLLVQQFALPGSSLGSTAPSITILNAWLLEFVLTAALLLTILATYKSSLFVLAISVGFVVFLEAWLFGPFTGASMNPTRSIGPAVISGHWEHLWIYITAPFSAAVVVSLVGNKWIKKV